MLIPCFTSQILYSCMLYYSYVENFDCYYFDSSQHSLLLLLYACNTVIQLILYFVNTRIQKIVRNFLSPLIPLSLPSQSYAADCSSDSDQFSLWLLPDCRRQSHPQFFYDIKGHLPAQNAYSAVSCCAAKWAAFAPSHTE